jgi:hypothetical protein
MTKLDAEITAARMLAIASRTEILLEDEPEPSLPVGVTMSDITLVS